MCGMAGIGLVLAAAGTAKQVAATVQAGEAQQEALGYNARLAANAAKASVLYGAGEAGGALEAGSRAIAKARVAAAAGGVDVQSEGVLSVLETSRETAALDAETIKNNALREALGYRAQEAGFLMQSDLSRIGTGNALTSQLLSGAGQMYQGIKGAGWLEGDSVEPYRVGPGSYDMWYPTVGKG